MDFERLYEEMYRLLPSGDIQRLTDVCHEIVGVPILVVDIMYNVLGIAPAIPTGDPMWDHLLEHRNFNTELIASLYKDGIIQSADNKDKPYVIDWGSSREHPKIQGLIRVNHVLEGYVTMQCTAAEITAERLKAMDIIMHLCSYFFPRGSFESSMSHGNQKTFAGELFAGRIQTEKQLKTWFHDMGCEFRPSYRLATVSLPQSRETNVLSYIRRYIQQLSSCQILLIQESTLYILYYQYEDTGNIWGPKSKRAFRSILTKFGACCGISNIFHNLLDTGIYQKQAEDAMNIGLDVNPDEGIYYYNDYLLPAILLPRIKEMPPASYVPFVLTEITNYDRQNGTEFLHTLKSFLTNLLSTANTAKALHIHRNTLLYRLNKLEELFALSLKDYHTVIRLATAFYMMELEQQFYLLDET